MGRCPRVEYEGAVYHVMSRGNRQEPIFRTDGDHGTFLETLGEACGRTGWRVHAFALMGNHYHLLIETPEPNLVDGMRRLQGTYTKRFNMRNRLRGHLFQGRYKALAVDSAGDYFSTVASYIHLNPARAKCFDLENGRLLDYAWSSYPLYLNPSKRPEWLSVGRTLGNLGWSDDPSGREEYSRHMQKRVLEIACSKKPGEVDERWAKIRQGWAYGGDGFRSHLQELLDGVMEGNRRDSYSGEPVEKHDEREAAGLLAEGLEKLGLGSMDLPALKKGDDRKKAIAWVIRKKTCVKNEWIARHLHMGRASNLSRYVKDVDDAREGILRDLKEMIK